LRFEFKTEHLDGAWKKIKNKIKLYQIKSNNIAENIQSTKLNNFKMKMNKNKYAQAAAAIAQEAHNVDPQTVKILYFPDKADPAGNNHNLIYLHNNLHKKHVQSEWSIPNHCMFQQLKMSI